MNIPRRNGSNDMAYRGGMYIQKSIADTLKINPAAIKTEAQLFDLLTKIKAGGFKDNNGRPVYPLGPALWGADGGRVYPAIVNNYSFAQLTRDYDFGLIDGKLVHEVETPYALKQVDFYRRLLQGGLIHPELFTMDASRAEEGVRSNSFAIVADAHNYLDFLASRQGKLLWMYGIEGKHYDMVNGNPVRRTLRAEEI